VRSLLIRTEVGCFNEYVTAGYQIFTGKLVIGKLVIGKLAGGVLLIGEMVSILFYQ
jgi:hypothetical protein